MSEAKLIPPPGYSAIVPFDKKRHAGLGLRGERNYAWCAKLNACYLAAAEFGRAATDYPIVFTRDPRTDEMFPLAVMGLRDRENLFVDEQGRWREPHYIPAHYRCHPFCLAEVTGQDDGSSRWLVCVQEDQLSAEAGEPLFDAQGEPAPAWEPIRKLLEVMEAARFGTRSVCRRLQTLGLLTAFDALAVPRQRESLRLKGMYRVDEQKLNDLPESELRTMLKSGELRAIYAHLVSLENFARLMERTRADEPRAV